MDSPKPTTYDIAAMQEFGFEAEPVAFTDRIAVCLGDITTGLEQAVAQGDNRAIADGVAKLGRFCLALAKHPKSLVELALLDELRELRASSASDWQRVNARLFACVREAVRWFCPYSCRPQ